MTRQHFEHAGRFWEVWVDGSDLYTRHGKVGANGQVKIKSFTSASEARAHRTKVIAEKTEAGYVKAGAARGRALSNPGPTKPDSSDPTDALAQAIYASPDCDDAFLVYADWLQEHGDPRGELAALQGRLAKQPNSSKLRATEQTLLWEQRAHFYGPLAPHLEERPLADEVTAIRATWRHGWIDRLELSAFEHYDDDVPAVPDVAALVARLPEVASARFLRELVLVQPVTRGTYSFAAAVKQLAKVWDALPMLKRLTIGQFPPYDRNFAHSDAGSLDPLWLVAQRLEYLKINCNRMGLAKLAAPALRELRIETGGLARKTIAEIAAGRMPALETLNIWFGQPDYGFDGKLEDLLPLLDRQRFPNVKHLGVANTIFGDDLASHWPTASILPELETLDLSRSHLTTTGIRQLAAHADAFAHLRHLDVSRCLLDRAGVKLAKRLCADVDASDQSDVDEYVNEDEPDAAARYTAVGE